jgi:diguanylate cyclase (GGDEF)-like protein/PAS domain S-box-containing protein
MWTSGRFTPEDGAAMGELELYKTIIEGMHEGVYFVDSDRIISFWNKGAERITGYAASEVLGRSCSENILVHVDGEGCELCNGGCPLSQSLREECEHKAGQIYLHHKDGHRVPVSVSITPIRNDRGVVVGAIEMFHEIKDITEEQQSMEVLRKAALLDHLTGLPNRRYLEMNLTSGLSEYDRMRLKFGVLMVDIDLFKKVNDSYGHNVGDQVLTLVASTMAANIRSCDIVGRWGGEEFVVIVRYVDKEILLRVAEKLRLLVGNSFLAVQGQRVSVTITLGGTVVKEGDTAEALLKRADLMLYEGKQTGRNRVVFG